MHGFCLKMDDDDHNNDSAIIYDNKHNFSSCIMILVLQRLNVVDFPTDKMK